MMGPPAFVRRLAVAAAVIAALLAPSAATLWIWTPDAADVQERVNARTDSYGIPLLGENDVPQLLARRSQSSWPRTFTSAAPTAATTSWRAWP